MGILKVLVKISSDLSNKNWEMDLLASEALKYYFFSKEAVQAYCSDVGVVSRREIALAVEAALNTFLSYEYSNEEIEFINDLLTKNSKSLKKIKKQDKNLYDRLVNLDSSGIKLLEIDESIDINKLKSCYRKASLKYHPDRGGSVEKMQLINEAFTLFHDAIVNYFPLNSEGGLTFYENKPKTLDEWKFSCYLILSCLQGDFFAADHSFESLVNSFEYSNKSRGEYAGRFSSKLIGFGGVLDRCARVLGRMQMREELSKAAEITSKYIDLYVKHWQPIDEYDFKPSRGDYPNKRDFEAEFGTKIVINHIEQAKNAYRLGKIDEKRYQKTIKKYSDREDELRTLASDLKAFYKSLSPQLEISKSDYNISSSNPKVISPISFFQDRLDFLDKNQKWEYLKAYSCEIEDEKIIKYLDIRFNEILLGIIRNFENLKISKIEQELNFYKDKIPSKRSRCLGMLEFIEHLSGLDELSRKEKLTLLELMDDIEQKSFSMVIVISLDFSAPKGGHKKRIEVNDDYLEFAQMNIEDIQKYKDTGDYSNDFNDAWARDKKALNRYSRSKVSKKREKYWLDKKNPTPEEVIESSRSYIKGLLELGQEFHKKNTGELQVGYDINRLTTAYAKLKDWKQVVYWAELFFNLPPNYLDRSSDGEQEKIKKRLERAKKAL